METQYFVCTTIRLMNYLCKKYDVVKIRKDNLNGKFSVFLFQDSLELRDYLAQYNNGLS